MLEIPWIQISILLAVTAWLDSLFFSGLLGLRHGLIFLMIQHNRLPVLQSIWVLGDIYGGLPWALTPLSLAMAKALELLLPPLESLGALWGGFGLYLMCMYHMLSLVFPNIFYPLLQTNALTLVCLFPLLLKLEEKVQRLIK